jgi:hypothetical protein
MTQDKPQMTDQIYASIMVALKKNRNFAEEQFEESNRPYWQKVIKEIDAAIQYVQDTF